MPILFDLLLIWLEIKHKCLIAYTLAYLVILGNKVKFVYRIVVIGNLVTV